VYDLVALALGAAGAVATAADGRRVRLAGLHAIKTEILDSLHRDDLSLGDDRFRPKGCGASRTVRRYFALLVSYRRRRSRISAPR
jgi:hypothetical protein